MTVSAFARVKGVRPLVAVAGAGAVAAAVLGVGAGPSHAAPQGGRPVYVTTRLSDDVAVFRPGPDGQLGKPSSHARTGDEPRGLVFAPDGRRAYGVNGGGTDGAAQGSVTTYAVEGDGALTPVGDPVPTGGGVSFGIAIDPAGAALYVTNIDSGTVTAFAIGSGRITRLGDPVSTGHPDPRGVAVSADGQWVFVSHGRPVEGRDDVVVPFPVQGDHSLGPAGKAARVGSGGQGVVVSPDGRFLYVVSTGSDGVFAFTVGRGGTLSEVPGSPFPAADFPEGAAVSPDGRLLFVTSPGPVRPDNARAVSVYGIGRNGALSSVPGSPFRAGQGPVGVAATPDGRHLYVSDVDSNDLSGFDVLPAGELRPVPGSPAPIGGMSPAFQSVSVLPDQGPAASFTAWPSGTGSSVGFDASGSADPDGRVVRYDWDFGDGTAVSDGGPGPVHAYQRPGTYTVTLTVTDDEGCSTRLVFTGQSPLCNGTGRARSQQSVAIGR
ncbi:beta-propeller fold lactonase family protein [Actinomadura fibrosa]|uniref:Beta-propeller fold lactonase family protein n=1 Tax=Actinomadura fibrosa TaxID=111802 RepID=A0ABW2XXT1_9ACTN|nr:PKD domain-containing protein [Actinomadura fibrosa]